MVVRNEFVEDLTLTRASRAHTYFIRILEEQRNVLKVCIRVKVLVVRLARAQRRACVHTKKNCLSKRVAGTQYEIDVQYVLGNHCFASCHALLKVNIHGGFDIVR